MEVKTFVFNPFYENTYVLWDQTKEALIVDPGCYEAFEREELTGFIAQHQLNVSAIVNTHCHIDHVLGNYAMKMAFDCPLWIPKNELDIYRSVAAYAPQWGIQQYTEAQPDRLLEESGSIHFGQTSLQILAVPGHSPGHLAFYLAEKGILIGGDVLFRESIGRTDLPGGNHAILLQNIREKLYTLPETTIVYPGHGPTTTIGHERVHNPFVTV